MSFAAKWVLIPAHGADRQTHFTSALAIMLLPGAGVDVAREKLQKEVLTPLWKVLKVPEASMVQGQWKFDFTKVRQARTIPRTSTDIIVGAGDTHVPQSGQLHES